jgi:hypothetical protein
MVILDLVCLETRVKQGGSGKRNRGWFLISTLFRIHDEFFMPIQSHEKDLFAFELLLNHGLNPQCKVTECNVGVKRVFNKRKEIFRFFNDCDEVVYLSLYFFCAVLEHFLV